MTFEDFYKSLREGKSLTNDNGMTYVHLEGGFPVVRVRKTNEIARTSPRIDFPPRGIIENETGYEVYKKSILNEAEKKYLSTVIKPFRDMVKSITKNSIVLVSANERCTRTNTCVSEFISIKIKNETGIPCTINLPYFSMGSMYRDMINDKNYTLGELGL